MIANKEKILSDCRPDWAFWACNGTIIRNIYELANSIHGMNQDIFIYHCNAEKNDFAKWVKEVLDDQWLAKKLEKEQNKDRFEKKVRQRIRELEKK